MLHKAGGLFKMNQPPPSTGRMTKMQRSTGFPGIWLEKKIIPQCLQLSPCSVPLTASSDTLQYFSGASVSTLWIPLVLRRRVPWEGCEIQSTMSEVDGWCHLLTGGNNESSQRLNAN